MKKIDVSYGDLVCEYAICTFPYGSRIYGTNSQESDFDYIYVVDDKSVEELDDQYVFHSDYDPVNYVFHSDYDPVNKVYVDYFHEINISIYGKTKFQQMCDDHHISALECIFLPDNMIKNQITDHKFKFELNLQQLRKSISEKASHSWVKAKKKFEVESDRNIYIGKKSLFHSIRIIDFGIQIARYGKIEYYNSGVDLWLRIKDIQSENGKENGNIIAYSQPQNSNEF